MRAKSNGGQDETFVRDASKTLAQNPFRSATEDEAYRFVLANLRAWFFFESDRYVLIESYTFSTKRSDPIGVFLSSWDILEETLDSYKAEDPASWKSQLYTLKTDILKIAVIDKALPVDEDFVCLLDFTPEDRKIGCGVRRCIYEAW